MGRDLDVRQGAAPLTIHRVTIARSSAPTIPEGNPPRTDQSRWDPYPPSRRTYTQNGDHDCDVGPACVGTFTDPGSRASSP
jgi:hypothetical protein